MITRLPFLLLMLLPFSLPFAGCARFTALSTGGPESPLSKTAQLLRTVPANSSQVLLVLPDGPSSALVYLFEKQGERWAQMVQPVKAVAGRNGFALPGQKREGDGKTPSGTFSLDEAFGYEATMPTRMPYRQVASDDVWVDDPSSRDYNRWVNRSETDASSFEELKRIDTLYRYAVVIGYNRNPIVPGRGSAIFLHVRAGSTTPTAGCIAMSEQDLLNILAWLDPARNPVIMINPPLL